MIICADNEKKNKNILLKDEISNLKSDQVDIYVQPSNHK